MAENLEIPGRQSVRSPMQWTSGLNGGFSSAPEDRVSRPLVSGSRWGPKSINVEAQDHDPDSLLNWMERMIRRRREMPEIAFGEWSFIPFPDAEIFALRYDWGDRTVLLLHNLGKKACASQCRLDGAEALGRPTRIQGQGRLDLSADGTASLDLPGYGCLWLRAKPAAGPG